MLVIDVAVSLLLSGPAVVMIFATALATFPRSAVSLLVFAVAQH